MKIRRVNMTRTKALTWFFAITLALGITVLCLPQTCPAQNDKDKKEKHEREDKDSKLSPEDAKRVKITIEEARAIALKRVAGTVVEEELEKEKGKIQYSFDIRDGGGKVWDVEIDAITGEILKAPKTMKMMTTSLRIPRKKGPNT
jgi:hypothetical protein